MELHILEHRVRVLSVARPGLWLYTHPLIKLLFLPRRSRCKFFSLTETPEDYTLMVDEEGFKDGETETQITCPRSQDKLTNLEFEPSSV
uniref:Cytosolic arginine sensor for mTORC1 subunit 1 n=1 Tax=Nomascus leucogenys TaxID=61853 RepID=A0A2I3GSK5_NOMLE